MFGLDTSKTNMTAYGYHASCKIHACQEFHQVIFDKTYLPSTHVYMYNYKMQMFFLLHKLVFEVQAI